MRLVYTQQVETTESWKNENMDDGMGKGKGKGKGKGVAARETMVSRYSLEVMGALVARELGRIEEVVAQRRQRQQREL